jgi:8-oxo-dGTP diphosphatase
MSALAEDQSAEKPRPTVGVQAAVFKDSRILLQRRANVFGDGTWGLPGGHLEFGESFEEAASRELAEECGVTALHVRTVLPHNTPYESTHYVQIVVEVLDWNGVPEIREPDRCSDLGFFGLTQLPAPLFEPSVHVLDHLAARSHTDAVQQNLSLVLTRSEGHGMPAARVAYLLLLGPSAMAIKRVGAPHAGKMKGSNIKRFQAPEQVWEWLSGELARRVHEGYVLQDCRGDAPLDRVLEAFPSSHPVALQSVQRRLAPVVARHQLSLLPEQTGW